MRKSVIPVSEDIVNYIQALDYEVSGLRILYTHAVRCDLPAEKTESIYGRFQEKHAEFQMAKDELWSQYKEQYPDVTKWILDYQSEVLVVEQGD